MVDFKKIVFEVKISEDFDLVKYRIKCVSLTRYLEQLSALSLLYIC